MKLLVFDVGGTEIKHSLLDENINMTEAGIFKTPKTPEEDKENREILDRDYEIFLDSLEKIYRKYENEVEGIAMSLPGFIDVENGRQRGGGAIFGIINREIEKDLSKRCGCPVKIANDAKCAAMAEKEMGALKGVKNAAVFIIGTGVGGGIIINDCIVNGSHFTAGELSFLRMNLKEPWDDPDNTMGDTCSTTGLLNLYKDKKGLPRKTELSGREFFERYREGEPEARESLQQFCNHVARAILNLTFILDLEKVAIGGGISRQNTLIEGIKAEIRELWSRTGLVTGSSMQMVEILPCRYLNEANQIGAYCYYTS